MEEKLKTIRLLHNLVLTVCVTVAAFSSSPDETRHLGRLSRALGDLREALSNYDRNGFDRYVEDTIEQETSFRQHLKLALDTHGIALANDFTASKVLPVRRYDDLLGAGPQPRKLLDIAALLRGPRPIDVFRPDDLRAELELWLAPVARTTATLYDARPGGINMAGRPTAECYLEVRVSRATFLEQQDTIRKRFKALPLEPRVVDSGDPVLITVDARIHGDFKPVVGRAFATWLSEQRTSRGANELLDPAIVAAISQVGGLDLDEARRQIEQKSVEAGQRRRISLLGVDVPADHVLIVSPLVILLLLTYFTSHLKDVLAVTQGGPSTSAFPRIGLFGDVQSRTLMAMSTLLLPLLAVGWLLQRLWEPWSWIWTFAFAISAAAVVQAVLAHIYTNRVRAALGTQS
jgi:hypothetical protein